MASLFSSSFRSPAGYTNAPIAQSTPMPALVVPTLPTVPAIDDARAPNAVGRSWISTQLGSLPGKYGPQAKAAQAGAQQALAGYGGWTWRADDPNTPQDESLQAPDYDPNAKLGAKQKSAVNAEQNASNSRGMLYSSFANKNIGSALTRLNEEARGILNQYAQQVNGILGNQNAEATSLITDWTRLYGEDSRWLVENPPPKPPDWMAPAGTIGDVWAGYHDPDPAGLESMYPGMSFSYRTDPDGRVVVSASPKPAAPAAAPAPLAPANPNSAAGSYPEWTGSAPPNFSTLAKAWGVPESYIRLSRDSRTGKYTAWAQQPPPGPR